MFSSAVRVRGIASNQSPVKRGFAALLCALAACSTEAPSLPGFPAAAGGSVNASGGAGRGGAGAASTSGGNGGSIASGGTSGGVLSGGSLGQGGAQGGASGAGTAGSTGGTSAPSPLCKLQLTCANPIVDDPKVPCTLQITDTTGATIYMDQAGVELRGRTSLRYPKKNYGVELRTTTGVENPFPMMGMGKEADWIFDGSWADRSFMRNDLVFSLFRDMGRYAPESRSCTLSLNGQAQGIYRMCEIIKRDDDRVALGLDDGSGSTFIVSQDEEGVLDFAMGAAQGSSTWELVYPKQDTATPAQTRAVQTWLNALKAALDGNDPSNPTTGVFAYLDFEATVDFILIEEFSKNIDAYNLSLTLFRNQGSKAAFIPWDFDLSFGQPTTSGMNNDAPEGWVQNRTPFITALSRVPALLARLAPRWQELRSGPLSNAMVLARLDQLQGVFTAEALQANFAQWPIEQVDFSIIYRPYTFYPVASYTEEAQRLRSWVQARLSWMDSRMGSYPN